MYCRSSTLLAKQRTWLLIRWSRKCLTQIVAADSRGLCIVFCWSWTFRMNFDFRIFCWFQFFHWFQFFLKILSQIIPRATGPYILIMAYILIFVTPLPHRHLTFVGASNLLRLLCAVRWQLLWWRPSPARAIPRQGGGGGCRGGWLGGPYPPTEAALPPAKRSRGTKRE